MNTSVSTRTSATLPAVPARHVCRRRCSERGCEHSCRVVVVDDVLVDGAADHLGHRHSLCLSGTVDPGALFLGQVHLGARSGHTANIYSTTKLLNVPDPSHRRSATCHRSAARGEDVAVPRNAVPNERDLVAAPGGRLLSETPPSEPDTAA